MRESESAFGPFTCALRAGAHGRARRRSPSGRPRRACARSPAPARRRRLARRWSRCALPLRSCAPASERSARLAIGARCVMHNTCRSAASFSSASPRRPATVPPTPRSISSKTIVAVPRFVPRIDLSASMTREISPPEATRRNGRGLSPGFAEKRNLGRVETGGSRERSVVSFADRLPVLASRPLNFEPGSVDSEMCESAHHLFLERPRARSPFARKLRTGTEQFSRDLRFPLPSALQRTRRRLGILRLCAKRLREARAPFAPRVRTCAEDPATDGSARGLLPAAPDRRRRHGRGPAPLGRSPALGCGALPDPRRRDSHCGSCAAASSARATRPAATSWTEPSDSSTASATAPAVVRSNSAPSRRRRSASSAASSPVFGSAASSSRSWKRRSSRRSSPSRDDSSRARRSWRASFHARNKDATSARASRSPADSSSASSCSAGRRRSW